VPVAAEIYVGLTTGLYFAQGAPVSTFNTSIPRSTYRLKPPPRFGPCKTPLFNKLWGV